VTKPARKPNLPPRSDSVTIITRAQPRNQNISPDRLAIEQALLDSPEALRPDVLATRTRLEVSRVRKFLQAMAHDGFAANTGTTLDPRWKACTHIKTDKAAATKKANERVANGNQAAAPASCLPAMASARPGADDHRLIPSREGNVLKPYRAPVSMVGAA
jgi:hypothetical protein